MTDAAKIKIPIVISRAVAAHQITRKSLCTWPIDINHLSLERKDMLSKTACKRTRFKAK